MIVLACGTAMAAHKLKQPQQSALDQYLRELHSSPNAAAAVASPGSVWTPAARFSGLAMDLRANRVGDVVTILVTENTSAVATGDVKTQRTSTLSSSVNALAGLKKATSPWTNLANLNTQTQLNGQGATTRTSVLTTTLTAHVSEVLPNGNMVVEAVKHVQVNSEDQAISIRGIIRPVDVLNDNTVSSDRVGQMELRVNGKGVIGDSVRRPFILYRLLMGLLPF